MHTLPYNFLRKHLFIEDTFVHFPSSNTCKSCGNEFWRGKSLPWETVINRVNLCNVCDKDFMSLSMHNQHIIWQHIGHVFVCKGCCKKFHTNISIHRYKKFLLVGQEPPSRRFSLIWAWWGGGKKEDGSRQLQEEDSYPLPTSLDSNCDIISKKKLCNIYLFKSRFNFSFVLIVYVRFEEISLLWMLL